MRKPIRTRKSQRGAVMVFATIAMLALVGMAGLALDMGHAYVNKAQLQNALDAAALSGAKTLDLNPGNIALAEAAAKTTFRDTATGDGNHELNAGVSDGDITVQFYSSLIPLTPDNVNPFYVRVSVNSFIKPMFLAQVLPGVGNTMTVGGSAMAGPSPTLGDDEPVCSVFPIMLCATNPIDPPGGPTVYGYNVGQEYLLTSPPGNHEEVGSGNYKLIRMGDPGASQLRKNMAGEFEACSSDFLVPCAGGDCVDTEPGQDLGPVAQGTNTRFGEYQGGGMNAQDYPPDTNTCQSTYEQYNTNHSCVADSAGSVDRIRGRRLITISVTNCDGNNNGQSELPFLGFACAFLTQKVKSTGPADERGIYAEITDEDCLAKGTPGPSPGPAPGVGPGPHTIQLYQDPLSGDS